MIETRPFGGEGNPRSTRLHRLEEENTPGFCFKLSRSSLLRFGSSVDTIPGDCPDTWRFVMELDEMQSLCFNF